MQVWSSFSSVPQPPESGALITFEGFDRTGDRGTFDRKEEGDDLAVSGLDG